MSKRGKVKSAEAAVVREALRWDAGGEDYQRVYALVRACHRLRLARRVASARRAGR